MEAIPQRIFEASRLGGVFLSALALTLLSSCEEPSARQTLTEKGIAVMPESLIQATEENQVYLVALLATAGVRPDTAKDECGRTPLMLAASAGFTEVVERLLEYSTDLNALDERGMSALAHAISGGRMEIAERLLAAGASADDERRAAQPLLASTVMHSQLDALKLLLDHGAKSGCDEALLIAVTEGKRPFAERLLNAGADPNAGAESQIPALNIALQNGDRETVDLLLAAGAEPNHLDDDSMRPIGYAICDGDTALAAELLSRLADPDLPCMQALTAMEIAVERSDAKAVQTLVEVGGAVIHPRLLTRAVDIGAAEVLAVLLDHGAPVDTPDSHGDTLLARAIRTGDTGQIELLLRRGANPSAGCREGQSLLALAVALKQPATVVELIASGADPNSQLADPVSESFRELVGSRTFSFYAQRDSRFTPIMVAAAHGDGETIRALMQNGASTNRYTRSYKRYPISFASEAGHIEAQQLIVGYDPRDRSDNFKIVIDLSSQRAVMYKNDSVYLSSRVSTGKSGYRTPTGEFVVTNKHRTWTSTLYDSPMPYFMRLSGKAFGTHVGYVPDYPASHGCIRMPQANAKAFFNAAPRGTLVSIVD